MGTLLPSDANQGPAAGSEPIRSYLALGDSFTEGLNDGLPDGSFRGWADRLAAHLDAQLAARSGPDSPGLRYGNLAVRGRLLDQIVREQLPVAVKAAPDLVSLAGGGNDLIRPGSDPDLLAERFDAAVGRLADSGGRVLLFTGFDTRRAPLLSLVRGKIATFNAHLHAVADRHGCAVVDLWSMRSLHDRRAWSADRLHLAPEGHRRVALRAAAVLGLPVDGADLADLPWDPEAPRTAAQVRREHVRWAREYLGPWVGRRLRQQSSGDGRLPKRPELGPFDRGAGTPD